MDALQLQYLQAMRIPVWVPRVAAGLEAEGAVCLHVGPGSAPVLLVCAEAGHSATTLASDLARALGGAPAWAWPDVPGEGSLEETVRERLLTGIAVFGADLARRLFGGSPPASLGTARVVVLPAMDELLADPGARRGCWKLLLESGLAARP